MVTISRNLYINLRKILIEHIVSCHEAANWDADVKIEKKSHQIIVLTLSDYRCLSDDCQLIADNGRPQLRSAHANVLTVPRTNTRLGDRNFSVAGPRIWNSLYPPHCGSLTLGHFKRLLKAFLFGETATH